MATISITSNDGKLDSASAVLEVSATNPEYNQPVLRIKQAGQRHGRNASNTAFETIVVFQRLGAGGNIGFRATKNKDFGRGEGVRVPVANPSLQPFGWFTADGVLLISKAR